MSLLIPVVFPQEDVLADENLQGLTGFDIVLFGYWETPDGVDPAVVRSEHEAEAQAKLYELAAEFSNAGAPTEVQLHFGPGGEQKRALQSRIVDEADSDAVVIPSRITHWDNILVPLRDDRNADRIVEFLGAFDPAMTFALELYHVTTDEKDVEAATAMLDGVKQMLFDYGFTETDIDVTVDVDSDPVASIVDQTRHHNVVVTGETKELDREDVFFGPIYERIAADADIPVVVVRDLP